MEILSVKSQVSNVNVSAFFKINLDIFKNSDK